MKKNEIYTVEITDITNLGFGVAKANGQVMFVNDAVTKDVAEVKIIKVQKSYSVARLERLITKSPLRLEDGEKRCGIDKCQSCAYKKIAYENELKIKENNVRATFSKAGLSSFSVAPIVPSPAPIGYRNKAQYPIQIDRGGNYVLGFFKPKTHTVTEAHDCPLAPDIFSKILEALCCFFEERKISVYDEDTGTGLLRHVYLRRGELSGEILIVIVINGDTLPYSRELCELLISDFPEIVGILTNRNTENTNVILGDRYSTLCGRDYIYDTLAGVKLKLSAPSFYQVNHGAAELLYSKAKNLAELRKSDTLLDLYCGVGSIGLSMAKDVKELIGIEIVPSAVECAKENAKENGIENAAFYTGDAKDCEKLLDIAEADLNRKILPDVIILDPPRAGCAEQLLRFVSSLEARTIVYISCNPSTLARDVKLLCEMGYDANEVYPFDLFPATGHVESVVCLKRRLDN